MKCNTCGKMNCMAHGGDVHERGVNRQDAHRRDGTSEAGHYAKYETSSGNSDGSKDWTNSKAKEKHHGTLGEMRAMPKPKLKGLAKGGAVEDDQMNMYGMSPDVPSMHPKTMKDGGDVDLDGDMDSELESMIGDELMEAFEKKDKAGILEAIKALVMSCGGKV